MADQPSKLPTRKVTAGALGGALTAIGIWAAGLYGLDVGPEAASGFTVLFTFVVSYFVADR